MIILTIKGNVQQARLTCAAHGITVGTLTERTGCIEVHVSDSYLRAVQAWYSSQDHKQLYIAGSLLWYRKSMRLSEVRDERSA